jgi:nucleoside-diphosphate-sugar epimerase
LHPILVTGGAGFIGSHLVERLIASGHGPVRVLDNFHQGCKENLASCWDRIEFLTGDVRSAQFVRDALREVGVIFHLAAQSNVLGAEHDMEYSFSTNVIGTLNVLRAARDAGAKRVVFTSSREVYGDPDQLPVPESAPLRPKNAYGASKLAGEAYCEAFGNDGLETVILRLANVYGPRDRDRVIPLFIERALHGEPLTINGGDQIVDFVGIEIVVDALVRAGFGEHIKGPVNVASGKGATIQELASRVLTETAIEVPVQYVSRHPAEVVGFVADVTRAKSVLNIDLLEDPLCRLDEVIDFTRNGLTPRKIAAAGVPSIPLREGARSNTRHPTPSTYF